MKVDAARAMLLDELRWAQQVTGRQFDVTAAVWRWWHAYKEWEGADTFKAAFRERRLCITQRPDEDNVTDTIKTSYNMEALRSTAKGAQKSSYLGVTYAVGVQSLAQRMDPANFTRTNSESMRRKYALGLFDLSASLLNPDYSTIKGQFRWPLDGVKKLWRIVFIPLPKPEDVELYNTLKLFADAKKDPVLLGILKFIRHRMTRPKMAAAEDMGAGPYDLAPKDSAHPKIKYGWKSNEGVTTQETNERVKTAATNYQEIIKNAKPITGRGEVKVVASNEITIALRQRNGKRFPIITRFDAEKNHFWFEQHNEFFPDQYIPDAWKTTRETASV